MKEIFGRSKGEIPGSKPVVTDPCTRLEKPTLLYISSALLRFLVSLSGTMSLDRILSKGQLKLLIKIILGALIRLDDIPLFVEFLSMCEGNDYD